MKKCPLFKDWHKPKELNCNYCHNRIICSSLTIIKESSELIKDDEGKKEISTAIQNFIKSWYEIFKILEKYS